MYPPHAAYDEWEDIRPSEVSPVKGAVRYRLKPVEVDAREFPNDPNADLKELCIWCCGHIESRDGVRGIAIHTPGHIKFAKPGCVILKHVRTQGFSIVRKEDFTDHYERVHGYR